MPMIRITLCVCLLSISIAGYAQTPYLIDPAYDPNHTWLGWYDAGLNTLPEQQGWSITNSPADSQPWMENNVLCTHSTVLQYLYWVRTDKYICFPTDHGLVVEFELKINSSQYTNISSNRWRTGYTVWAADHLGRTIRVGIADAGVILSNDYDWGYENSSSFAPYTTTDGFHVYRLVIQNHIGQLSIDGNPVVTIPAGSVNQTTPNRILFGDATYHAFHNAELKFLRYGLTLKTGDTDGDSVVDLTDLANVAYHWLSNDCGCMSCCDGADMNHSGSVNLEDLAIISLGWIN